MSAAAERQGDLFTNPLRAEFERFHEQHPDVFAHFDRIALDLIHRGVIHYSSDAICHVVRWHIETTSSALPPGDFKINDHFTPFYARMFHDLHPEHLGFFELRRSAADREVA